MEQIIQTFSESFKRSVVDQVNNGLISKEEARRQYGIKSKSGILLWQRNYQKYGRCSLNLPIDTLLLKPKKQLLASPSLSEATLLTRIKELERQLEDEQLRSEAYNRMIDIAERNLNIPIRKKSNTK
jgi:transposase-like protein